MTTPHEEVTATLFALHHAYEDLIVRGLRSCGPDDLRHLEAIGDELARAGAGYVAGAIAEVVHRVREAAPGAPRALLRAQTATRVFERVLSLDAAAEVFGGGGATVAEPAPRAAPSTDATALAPVLEELAALVEGLVASGMTTASAATRTKLDAAFKEASRLKLLRLAASLRYVGDECGRFVADSPQFSARRLAFFLNRTWLISRGLLDAIARDDRAALARLLWQPPSAPVGKLVLGVLGVHKRALLDGSAAFEFRTRVLADAPGVAKGTRLVWSCVFGAKPGVPAEAFLHLPQAQKFMPKLLLEPTEIVVTDAAVSLDEHGGGRLLLGPKSTVKAGAKLKAWDASWDPATAAARIKGHPISPLDLEVELQEEVVLADWEIGAPEESDRRPEHAIYPITAAGRSYEAIASRGADGEALRAALDGYRKRGAKRPPLFGIVHYEMARLVLQPLAALGDAGPTHLMIAADNIDLASLMKTLDFT